MAVTLQSASGRARRPHGAGRYRPMAEINVTPLVDVMLVLLIIFMVTAPLLTVGVPVDLPKTKAAARSASQDEPLVVTVDGDGKIYPAGDRRSTLDQLVPRLQAITGSKPDARIFVRGDKEIDYGRVHGGDEPHHRAGFTRWRWSPSAKSAHSARRAAASARRTAGRTR